MFVWLLSLTGQIKMPKIINNIIYLASFGDDGGGSGGVGDGQPVRIEITDKMFQSQT